jgi:hypothetical protein
MGILRHLVEFEHGDDVNRGRQPDLCVLFYRALPDDVGANMSPSVNPAFNSALVKPLDRLPAEVQRRQERKAQLQRAKAEMEARAYARFQAEPAEHEAKLARRSEAAASGKPPRGRAPQAPALAPQSKDQVNFTDPASRIMKTKDGFPPADNGPRLHRLGAALRAA